MRPLSDTDIVRVWEHGCRATPVRRAMALIAAASERADEEPLTALTPGERDARLLAIRRLTFGRSLECVVRCPACREQLEFVVETSALLADDAYAAQTHPVTVTAGDHTVTVRPPTLGDIEGTAGASAVALLDRCVVHAERDGVVVARTELPDAVIAAVDAQLSAADPAALMELAMCCPSCAHAWTPLFDIGAFLWTEIAARAERLLREVHTLARAYGWSEGSILALGPVRRERYLELVRA
jgi:hypothetical protein